MLRWWLPALAYAFLVPLCYVGIVDDVRVRHVADFIGHQINTFYIIATFVFVGIAAYRRRGTAGAGIAWWMLDTPLVLFLCGDIWKLILNAPRPAHPGVPDHGFPSGHTMSAFALAYVVTEIDPRWGVIWYVNATLMGWSRVEGVAHYPYQVILGAPMGFAIGMAVTHIAHGVFVPRCYRLFTGSKAGKAATPSH